MPRMYRTLPYQGGEPRDVAEVVNNAMNGKTNNSGTFTLATSSTETTVSNERVGFDSVIVLSPARYDLTILLSWRIPKEGSWPA